MAGSGTLQMSGSAANTYTGTTTVSAGTLELNKSGATAIAGTLNITGGVARELASNQISDTAILNVNSGATFDLNNLADVIRVVNVVGGSVSIGTGELDATNVGMTGGSIASTGSGSLVLFGDLATSSAPTAATISGNLNLGGFLRTFTIADGAAAVDLDLSAVVSSSLSEGLTKAGAGTLRLDGLNSNTYPGLTIVSFGTLELAKANGAIAAVGDIEIDNGVVRELGPNQIGDNADVSVFSGATFDLGNFTDLIGGLAETGANVRIGAGTLTAGPVTMAGGTISSTGAGKLVLKGDVVNNSALSFITGSLDLGGERAPLMSPGALLPSRPRSAGRAAPELVSSEPVIWYFQGTLSNTYYRVNIGRWHRDIGA